MFRPSPAHMPMSSRPDEAAAHGEGIGVSTKWRLCRCFLALVCVVAAPISRANYSNLFVFGDSLSDSGNIAALTANRTPVPISGNGFIPTFPYASGHYTNGQVWAQDFASALGLSANPSLLGGTDYAFGGATTGPLSPNAFPGGLLSPLPPSLETQAAYFLFQHGGVAPSDALYVVAGGGNDARDALNAIGSCGNSSCVAGVIGATALGFATDIATIVSELETAGAENIVVWDTPDVGLAPAILTEGAQASALGTLLASAMNSALLSAIGGAPGVTLFDIFGLEDSIAADPAAFDLTNVTDACAQFVACDPSTYLFWDGIHPTSAGAQIISNAMLERVPEPATIALLGLGLAGLGFSRRRRQ
jgi:outer membrane lipase/esterase